MNNFLLEIYCEEIPAKMQKNAEQNFGSIYEAFFSDHQIPYENLKVNIGPCRIVVSAQIAKNIEANILEIKGPKVASNEQAILGFCKSNNISKDQLIIQEVKGQEFFFYIQNIPEQSTKEIIAKKITEYISRMIWPKSMVWGSGDFTWVRPIRSILCMIDNEVIKFKFANLQSSNITYGHKFMCNEKTEVNNAADYFIKMKELKVIISREERDNIIQKSLDNLCKKLSVSLNKDDKLLEEVIGLAEYPVVLHGSIDNKFMALPPEVLISSMRHHQKYFTCSDEKGNLAPYFIFVTNLDLKNYSEIIFGNQRVLNARLEDALYFYNTDKAKKLESNKEKLKEIIFHTKIGSVFEKTLRIAKLCEFISPGDKDAIEAAKLCKLDLVTEMVCEFPELQGIMGSYYAATEGANNIVSTAIKNHYKPLGIDDDTPKGSAATVSLADKIDSLISLYTAGERATSSKDPYALRRYALCIIRIILDNQIHIDLKKTLIFTLELLNNKNNSKIAIDEILIFIEERYKYFLYQNFPREIVNAAIDIKSNPDLLLSYKKLISIDEIMKESKGKDLLSLFKRLKNIAQNNIHSSAVDSTLLKTLSEKEFYIQLQQAEKNINLFLAHGEFYKALLELHNLASILSRFFEENLVNTEELEISNNRKKLLSNCYSLFIAIANFNEFQ